MCIRDRLQGIACHTSPPQSGLVGVYKETDGKQLDAILLYRNNQVTVSYTHLDVYKRQVYINGPLETVAQELNGNHLGIDMQDKLYQNLSLIHI